MPRARHIRRREAPVTTLDKDHVEDDVGERRDCHRMGNIEVC